MVAYLATKSEQEASDIVELERLQAQAGGEFRGERPIGVSVGASVERWRHWAVEAIVALLESDGAATQRGMEAKIADVKSPGQRYPINPHHLTSARKRLLDAGVIEETRERTRGGGVVPVFTLSSPTKPAQRATGRKRLTPRPRLTPAPVNLRRAGHRGPAHGRRHPVQPVHEATRVPVTTSFHTCTPNQEIAKRLSVIFTQVLPIARHTWHTALTVSRDT